MGDDLVQRLREALSWYANPVLPYAVTQISEPRSAVHADGGRRARAALAEADRQAGEGEDPELDRLFRRLSMGISQSDPHDDHLEYGKAAVKLGRVAQTFRASLATERDRLADAKRETDRLEASLASAQERIAALEAGPQVDDAMVERAARGIVKRLGYDPDQPVGEIGGGRVLWQLSTGDARAALLAALTPTSET